MTPEEVAERVSGRRSGTAWMARCPAHEDRSPSLSISPGDHGGVLVKCHAGCATEDVVKAAGLTMGDLAPPEAARGQHLEAPLATYAYVDEHGTHLFDVVRLPGKRFYQRPANGKRGAGAMDGVRRVLYRLPDVMEAVSHGREIFIVEGEKDADRLYREGYYATTSPGGAGKWKHVADHARIVLHGATVTIVADKDKAGTLHAKDIAASLNDVATVRTVQAITGKDASDHLDAGHTAEEWDTWTPVGDESPTLEREATPLALVDWQAAFDRPPVDAMVDGAIFPGRWTAYVAPAKTGKSTLALHISHCLARGVDPFTGASIDPIDVLYLDGEMGELDVVERFAALDLTPADLQRLHYTDLVPKGDTVPGGVALVSTALHLRVGLVVLDGLNAFVSGAEKDDTPWRNLYEQTVAPLKRAGIAVLSTDNTGKDVTLSARGSSAKLDKADAIIAVKRTEGGVSLTTTHQRSSGFLRTLDLAVRGLNGEEPITYRHTLGSWPHGTSEGAALLDRLNIPTTLGRERTRAALKAAGETMSNDVLAAAIRFRKTRPQPFTDTPKPVRGQVATTPNGQDERTGEQI